MPDLLHSAAKPGDPHHHASLRQRGLRPNRFRIAVLRILDAAAPHALVAEQIFQQARELGVGISQGTVYRVLRELEQCDFVQRDRVADPLDNKHRYRSVQAETHATSFKFVCPLCARQAVVDDKNLCGQLARQAQLAGFDQPPDSLRIEAMCSRCA